MSVMGAKNLLLEISQGKVPGSRLWGASGERESMAIVASGSDLWRGNELTPVPSSHTKLPIPDSAGEQMSIVSEHANDSLLGVGVRKVEVGYIDADGFEQLTEVELNGTTPVDLSVADVRFVNRMHTSDVGANGAAVGHIKIWKKSDHGLVYSMIAAESNISSTPTIMVPKNHYFTLLSWHAEEAQSRRCLVRLLATAIHYEATAKNIFYNRGSVYLKGNTQAISGEGLGMFCFPELSILKMTAWADAVGAESSAAFWGVLTVKGK
jgi:hypothetical protein